MNITTLKTFLTVVESKNLNRAAARLNVTQSTVSARIDALEQTLGGLREKMAALDARIAPLAKASAELWSPSWGLLMRAGNDKSHFARQVERYADVYTSRVSNLLYLTPFAYLRSPRGSLPHDPGR